MPNCSAFTAVCWSMRHLVQPFMRPRKDARPPLTQDDPKRRKGVLTMAQVEGRRQWDNVWKRAGEQRLANAGIHLGCCCAKRGECPASSACCVGPTKLNRLSQQRQGRQWETSVAVNRSNTQQETVPQEGRNQQTGHSGGTCNDENPVGFSRLKHDADPLRQRIADQRPYGKNRRPIMQGAGPTGAFSRMAHCTVEHCQWPIPHQRG